MRQYMDNIINAVVTTVKGMRITLRYWVFEPSITVEYPDRLGDGVTAEDLVAERFRGFLGFEPDNCTGCLRCQRICPIDCIRVGIEKRDEGRYIAGFDVNQAKCMHCGLCVEECPSGAVFFTKGYEGASFDMAALCFSHLNEPVPVAKRKKEGAEQA